MSSFSFLCVLLLAYVASSSSAVTDRSDDGLVELNDDSKPLYSSFGSSREYDEHRKVGSPASQNASNGRKSDSKAAYAVASLLIGVARPSA